MGSHYSALLRHCASVAHRSLVIVGSSGLVASGLCASSFANDATASAAVDGHVAPPVYSLRLSVINGGYPRDAGLNPAQAESSSTDAIQPFADPHPELDRSRFTFVGEDKSSDNAGTPGSSTNAQPIAGDFDGDGDSERGIFRAGQWFIDLNGNGVWDQDDLWARLGNEGDQPIVGDWDSDGKADIGVYGERPAADANSAPTEPGLPDANNDNVSDNGANNDGANNDGANNDGANNDGANNDGANNDGENTSGTSALPIRLVKRGATGLVFHNTIDHCFDLGTERGIAVAGDFNGDGVDTVAIFREGRWTIDVNGDGQSNDGDIEQDFGQADDRPIAGDFDGDGVDEIGVYRDGNWLISTDATDAQKITEFQLGGPGQSPVVGDWDGDGTDSPAVYRDF